MRKLFKITAIILISSAVNMDRYIERNEFQKLEAKTDVEFEQFLKIDNSLADASTSADLYYTKGSYKEETWQSLLDKPTGRLWVTLRYED